MSSFSQNKQDCDIRNYFECINSKYEKIDYFSCKQNEAFKSYLENKNIFITGSGGSGKSFWIKEIYKHAKENNKKISVTAMTGCASILLDCNATTIHTWGSIGIGNDTFDNILKKIRMYKKKDNWINTEILIIDEISMMSQYIFEMIDYIARKIRRNNKLFGGIQLICSGDFYQLPPVSSKDTIAEKRNFCFESPIWNDTFHTTIIFDENFRQNNDLKYMEILEQIRNNNLNIDNIELLIECTKKKIDETNEDFKPTLLYPLKRMSDEYNIVQFNKLEKSSTKKYTTQLYRKNNENKYEKLIKETKANTTLKQKYFNNFMLENELELCVGCKVMVTANIDFDAGIVNGSQGKIVGFETINSYEQYPVVEFTKTKLRRIIEPHSWLSNDEQFKVEQLPLILSWAITIHKSQGITLENARINLGSSVFEYGQSYVALSRVKSLNGLYLDSINFKKIKTNPKVVKFYRNIKNK